MEHQSRVRNMFSRPERTTEKNNGLSLTVPDHSMSIREIMIRHSRGLSLTSKVPLYHDDDELETADGRNPATMDLVEVQQEMAAISERLEENAMKKKAKRTQQEKDEAAKKEQELRDKWKKEFEEEQKNKQK